jgi:hypothetical protein
LITTWFGRLVIKRQRERAGRPRSGLGQVLAAIVLLLQIAIPAVHPSGPFRFASDAVDLSAAFDEHALCLSGGRGKSETPSDQTPKPLHHEFAACCFWHGNTTLAVTSAASLEPVAFARSRVVFTPSAQVPARRLTGAIGARAPPIQA